MRIGEEGERLVATATFSATSFVVFAALAVHLDGRSYASVSLAYVAASVVTNMLRYGLFDAMLARIISPGDTRAGAGLVAAIAVLSCGGLVAFGAAGSIGGAATVGSVLAVGGDLARMLRLSDGRCRFVMIGDLLWLFATLGAGLSSVAMGGAFAVGAVLGWVIGGATWTLLVFADRPDASTDPLRGLRALWTTAPLAISGTGAFVGYLMGLGSVAALGQLSAVAVMDLGRMVGMPALTIYSGLRFGLVAQEPGTSRSRSLVAIGLSAATVSATVLVVVLAPIDPDSALVLAQRYWPLIWVGQIARLGSNVLSDLARPRLSPRAGWCLGGLAITLGALLPPALASGIGESGGAWSQLAIAFVVGGYSWHVLRGQRRAPAVRAGRMRDALAAGPATST